MQPQPPPAPKRPTSSEHHGRVLMDDYAWMRDENWQQVLRDPFRPARRYQGAPASRERLHRRDLGSDHRLAGDDLRRDARPDAGGRQLRPDAGRARGSTTHRSQPGRSSPFMPGDPGQPCPDSSPVLTGSNRGPLRTGSKSCSTWRRWAQGHAFFRVAAVRHSADHRLLGWAEDAQGSEVYPHPRTRPSDGQGCRPGRGGQHRLLRHLALRQVPVLGVPRRQRTPAPGDAPPDRRGGGCGGV